MEKAIPLDKFIEHSLYDKKKGYYINKNPIGENGDFIPLHKYLFIFLK